MNRNPNKGDRIMPKILLVLFCAGFMLSGCAPQTQESPPGDNPLLAEFDTPFQVPPYDLIKEEHYLPAFKKGMEEEKAEIAAILNNAEEPSFENTIAALDASGELLTRVQGVFYPLRSADTNEKMMEIAREIAPLLSKHGDDIALDPALFQRVKAVYLKKETLDLDPEQSRLLEKTYKDFVRSGADLPPEKQARLREINEQLSVLSLQFGDNVLAEDNAFQLVIEDEADLAGLPPRVVAGAAEAAEQAEQPGKWIFTLHKPSLLPFLQYSEKRDFREKMFKAYIMRGDNGNAHDNKNILSKIAALRAERAALMGYESHAAFVLEENMAKVPENVYKLLEQLWTPTMKRAREEAAEMQALIDAGGGDFKLQPWDWGYYAEKIKQSRYQLDENQLRPYFQLEKVRDGAFNLAGKLWGLRFEERSDIPVYHEDVRVFEVKEEDGSHLGVLYVDYFPRPSKRGGAWSTAIRKQRRRDGVEITPVIANNGNFSKPAGGQPALISFDETLTLFHEFGHALHGLLSDCTYSRLSGTSVPRDFVELPSQIMEHWAAHPEYLKQYALHYQTGEPIPDELIEKIRKSGHFNQGFVTGEYLAASFLDMDWHTLQQPEEKNVGDFEQASMQRIGLIPEIVPRYRSTYFSHIFSGGYSSGYYSYIWAEVLDCDAFQAFEENGIFDRETARRLRDEILSKGGTREPMDMYVGFRGAEPKIDALLEKRGLK
jgi:peptidyl-dipeptidase Dcp